MPSCTKVLFGRGMESMRVPSRPRIGCERGSTMSFRVLYTQCQYETYVVSEHHADVLASMGTGGCLARSRMSGTPETNFTALLTTVKSPGR